jgi:protein arginine kinase
MTQLPDSLLHHIPWNENVDPIWPASSFFLHRNIVGYNFPSKLTPSSSKDLLALLKKSFSKLEEIKDLTYLPAEVLSPQEKAFLCEHFLGMEGWQNASEGSAFILDSKSHFLALLNIKDHLLLQWIDSAGQWDKAWNDLSEIENSLGKHLSYAFSSNFGYLTSDPKNCGTALTVICYLHLPCLIHANLLSDLISSRKDQSINALGISGTLDELEGDFLLLKNNYTLGLAEESILRDLHVTATQLILAEKNKRKEHQELGSSDLKDAISRAYGLLKHSFQLETKEALKAISSIKLGIDLGWVKGVTDSEINEIFFHCRRAHILQAGEKVTLNKKELAHVRAELLHEKLKAATLTF